MTGDRRRRGITPLCLPLPERRPTKRFTIEVREAASSRVVTVIEILSRANKRAGKDRRAYLLERDAWIDSAAHFIELDLLRTGRRWRVAAGETVAAYRLILSRAGAERNAEIWPFTIRDPLPTIPVPLRAPDPDVPLDLGAAARRAYDEACYDLLVDYGSAPPPPELPADDVAWLDARRRAAGARR